MKTFHGGPGEHRSHLYVAVFFSLGGGVYFFLLDWGSGYIFSFYRFFFVPSEPDSR